jgi:6-phosphogluconolactonase/glucosamine-6-phosphate isomerase/deaminase
MFPNTSNSKSLSQTGMSSAIEGMGREGHIAFNCLKVSTILSTLKAWQVSKTRGPKAAMGGPVLYGCGRTLLVFNL